MKLINKLWSTFPEYRNNRLVPIKSVLDIDLEKFNENLTYSDSYLGLTGLLF